MEKSLQIGPCIYVKLIFEKLQKQLGGEIKDFSTNTTRKIGYPHAKICTSIHSL